MILAWLLLLTGLTISAVAIYYSVVGLAAIFSAAVIPIIVMGSALEVAKLVCASWLKANWTKAPKLMKLYMTVAVSVLMLITSMGIFGFLSKAHSDQSLVSGDVQSKIAIYDEKIKTARENIEADRKQLKQMDEAVDQVMGRSTDEKGADKANAIRRSQQKDRAALAKDIETNQKLISTLNDEAAPIRAEVRKVEAEVGPLKYIAAFVYGATDESILERAVTWVIITIIVVFDPLAVIMLLAAQMTFGWHNKGHDPLAEEAEADKGVEWRYLSEDEYHAVHPSKAEGDSLTTESKDDIVEPTTVTELTDDELNQFGYLEEEKEQHDVIENIVEEQTHTEEIPSETPSTALGGDITAPEEPTVSVESELDKWNGMVEEAEQALKDDVEAKKIEEAEKYVPEIERPGDYLTDRNKPDLTEVIEPEGSKKKTYMMKDPMGHIQVKNKE